MKRKISFILVITILFSLLFQGNPLVLQVRAADESFRWIKNDTLDIYLDVVENKAGATDILLELELEDTGLYTLQYFLEDGKRTTVTFDQKFNALDIYYMVEEPNGLPATTNITQDEIDASYLEMNYGLEVPTWEYIETKTVDPISGALKFTIEESAGIVYPGVAFEINNKRVILKWDFQTDKIYYLMDNYELGTIVPTTYTNPGGGSTDMNILKGLEDFDVVPTHIRPNAGLGDNEDLGLVEHPGDDKPGSEPGLQMTFKQPRTLDTNDWIFKYTETNMAGLTAVVDFNDIATGDYLDFNFSMNDDAGSISTDLDDLPDQAGVNNGVTYDYTNYTYKVDLVEDKTGFYHDTDYLQWDALSSSSIYDVNIGIQVEAGNPQFDDFEFASYKPINNFAYTYMEYELRRANMTEAYLDIIPYNVGSEDEIQYDILYSKVKKDPLDPDNDLWVQHFHDGTNDEGANIFIPVPFNADSSQDVYQIIVSFSGNDLTSQVLNYIAEDDDNIPPTTPKIENLTNLFVIPSDIEGVDLSRAQFDIEWSAPENRDSDELDTIFANVDGNENNDSIYYELMVNEVPEDTLSNPFEVIKVIEIYLQGGELLMKLHDQVPLPRNGTPSDVSNFDAGYNDIDQTYRMDNVTIFDDGAWCNTLNTVADETGNTYVVSDSGSSYNFEYPGVNYLRMRAITKIDGMIGISYNSLPVSLSLSLLEHEIPIVEGITYSTINGTEQNDPVGATIEWHTVAVDSYEANMLTHVGKSITEVDYEVYISQDQDALLDLDVENVVYDALVQDSDDNIFLDENDPVDMDDIEELRDGAIKMFTISRNKNDSGNISVDITGLDQNTNYYVRIVTDLDIEDKGGIESEKSSEPSNILSITTPIIPSDPDEGEVKPLSVENLIADYADENYISGLLTWDYPAEIVFAEDRYGFEVFSIEGTTIPDSLNSREIRLEELYEHALLTNADKEMWRITIEDGAMNFVKYDEDTDTWLLQDADDVNITDQHAEMLDPVNTPNKIYYYYVRTINTFEGSVNAASSWMYDSLTTSPVQAPINLTAVYDSGYGFDEKTESIIRFDAPIPENADLNNDYIMEIYVKGEDDDDYTMNTYPYTFLGTSDDGALGYTRMYYRISGLKTGSAYSVKVRIEDRTKEQEELPTGELAYSKSPFSERIIIRTEFDQGEYEKEFVYDEYLDHYDRLVGELLQQDYFILDKDNNDAIIKYRDEYGTGSLINRHDNSYELLDANLTSAQQTHTYYLPASFFKTANSNDVIISILPGDNEIGIRPYSIGETITPAIKNALEEIRTYESDMVDYYVKLVVNSGPYNSTVNDKLPASDVVSISMSVYGATNGEIYIDQQMVEALNTIIAEHRELLKPKLLDALESGINEELLLDIVQAEIEMVSEDHYSDARQIMNAHLMNDYRAINTSNKNVYIQIASYGQALDQEAYYRKNGIWEKVDSTYYNNNYFIETKDMTSYILVTRDSDAAALQDDYSLESIGVINKYDLTEIFTVAELQNKQLPVQKYQVISALARLLNASVGYDNASYLEDMGVDVDGFSLYSNLSRDEMLYLYTQSYAVRHNINLDSVYIYDYNLVEDLNQADYRYREVILKGANLNLFDMPFGLVLPNDETSIEELIELLTRIENGLY